MQALHGDSLGTAGLRNGDLMMAAVSSVAVFRDIQTLFDSGTASGLSDRQLLERFVNQRDVSAEAAFETWFSVTGRWCCGSAITFSATGPMPRTRFRRRSWCWSGGAGRSAGFESIGSWLYGVACRVAARARVEAARRRSAERRGGLRVVEAVDSVEAPKPTSPNSVRPFRRKFGGCRRNIEPSWHLLLAGIDPGAGCLAARLPPWDGPQPPGSWRSLLHRRLTRRGLVPLRASLQPSSIPLAEAARLGLVPDA